MSTLLPAVFLLLSPPSSEPVPAGPATLTADAGTTPVLSWCDYDGDGLLDLLVHHRGGALLLLRNTGRELVDVTERVGLGELAAVRGAVWVDLDGDGRRDLLALEADGAVRALGNDAGVRFLAVDAPPEVPLEAVSVLEVRDVDADGREDLVVVAADGVRVLASPGGAGGALVLAGPPPGVATAAAPGPEAAEPAAARRGVRASAERPGRPAAPREESGADATPLPTGPSGPFGELHPSPPCAPGLEDQAGGGCLEASSLPTLGALFPLSPELFVEAGSGQVGLGTTLPNARLDVRPVGETGISVTQGSTGSYAASFQSPTSSPTPTMFVSGGVAGFLSGDLQVGYRAGLPSLQLRPRVILDDPSGHGRVTLQNDAGVATVELLAEEVGGDGGQVAVLSAAGARAIELDASQGTGYPQVSMFNPAGTLVFSVQASSTTGATALLENTSGKGTIRLDAENSFGEGELALFSGPETVEILADDRGTGGQIELRDLSGDTRVRLSANQFGRGRVTTDVLQVTGGADLVESFDTGEEPCAPGTVVVIDPVRPGSLAASRAPYDRGVAGVVSGAGGVEPGIELGQRGVLDGDTPVALSGRVFARCSGENGAIRPGDLLTTAATAGHAMRATDHGRAGGAVLGKAMGSLAEGETGLVLVLVNLQ